MSELASESMGPGREADAGDGGGRARDPMNARASTLRAGLLTAIA